MKTPFSLRMLAAVISLLSYLNVSGQSNEVIWLTSVPDWGNASAALYGKVNANPQAYRVAGLIFIEEAGGWWTKPSFANPTVSIEADSSFTLDFTTGGLDQYCTRLLTVLVPNNYQVPVFGGVSELPADFLTHPYAIVARPHGDRQLEWEGINWTVKRTVEDIAISPGPNLFCSDEDNVFIDGNSHLHLLINNMSGYWLCSELISDTSLGFGTYTFNLKSRVDNLDLHAVIGIFTWDDVAKYSPSVPEDYYREYDIEFSYWSTPGNDVGQYVIQPWNFPENIFRFPVGSEINTIHQWTWKKDTIEFISMHEDSSIIARFEYTGDQFKYPGAENIRINLWLNFGQAPSGFQEAILSGFEFENLLPAPQNVTATDGNPMWITVNWNGQPGKLFGIYRGISNDPLEAKLLTEEWISQSTYIDSLAETGKTYYYWVRSSDNSQGSNTTGYASGYSDYDTAWAADTTMSVLTHDLKDRIRISPNPCDEYASITPGNNWADGFLRLFDSRGMLVLEKQFVTGELLVTAKLSPGIYFLQLVARNGDIFSARLIVDH
jgi:hypothetical protein